LPLFLAGETSVLLLFSPAGIAYFSQIYQHIKLRAMGIQPFLAGCFYGSYTGSEAVFDVEYCW